MYKNILHATEHREFPLPDCPWLMTQKWKHLLFVHYPVDHAPIARLLPDGLELDTYSGQACLPDPCRHPAPQMACMRCRGPYPERQLDSFSRKE